MFVIRFLFLGCVAIWLAGCARSQTTSKPNTRPANPQPALALRDAEAAQALEVQLKSLDASVNAEEARRLAECAVATSRQLAREYSAIRPAFFHNMLVNAGWKKRGLCHHWADDLYDRFRKLDLRTLELDLAIARPGTWREHNAVVVKAAGHPFDRGVVLDAWRRSGRLYFCGVSTDRHPWQVVMARDDGREAAAQGQGTEGSRTTSPASSSLLPESVSRP